ncbi:MAG: hypothetical protein KA791_09040 [Flavobacteriales bacterium]|nr:hypothetical protein [Flavobacteriales bacterium]
MICLRGNLVAAAVLTVATLRSTAQATNAAVVPKNALHFDFWLLERQLGLNYERLIVHGDKWRISMRTGIYPGQWHDYLDRFNPGLYIPMGPQLGLGRRAQLELGGGAALYSKMGYDVAIRDWQRQNTIRGWASIGVRAGEPSSQFFARAALMVDFIPEEPAYRITVGFGMRF